MKDRFDVIRLIPKPRNEDVIIYDMSLKDLIDKDVFSLYKETLNLYELKVQKYKQIEQLRNEYEKNIDGVYLYNKAWNEEDYLSMLQNLKVTYNTVYKEIKKIEDTIVILEKKIKSIDEQINLQRQKDIKEIESKRDAIDGDIIAKKEELRKSDLEVKILKEKQKILKDRQNEIVEDNDYIDGLLDDIQNKTSYTCKYCGTKVTNASSRLRIANMLEKTQEKNKSKLKDIQEKLDETNQEIKILKDKISTIKDGLNNDVEFKKQDYNFYIKKSVTVLQLEAERDKLLNKIWDLKNQYQKEPMTTSKKFLDLKDTISKCELSLENLNKIKEQKEDFINSKQEFETLKTEIVDLYNKLVSYKKFITLYFKIYEKKANDYFGNDIKFKLYRFDDFKLTEIFEIYYKDTEYSQLLKSQQAKVDEIYNEKISNFS